MTLPSLRIAIAQPAMFWTAAENVERLVATLAIAAAQGAELCVTPELSATGFHRGIREQARPEVVGAALEAVRAACRRHDIACAVGMPTHGDGGAILNSYVLVGADGEVRSTVSKNGLTPAELTFFAAGSERPVSAFAERACTTVMCREMDDIDAVAGQLRDDPVGLVFWPSLVGNPPGTVHPTQADTDDLGYTKRAAAMARRLEAFVVQSNWPQALNTPAASYLGESKVYAPDGEALLMLPRDEAGVAVFALGERDYRWTPMPA